MKGGKLRERHADLPLTDFAAALLLPIGTLEDWLRPGRAVATAEPSASVPVAEVVESDIRQTHVETVLAQWRSWNGDFSSFCAHVREHHRVPLGRSLIANILFAHGERTPERRPGRSRDEEALRGAFETFFPGAQWVGDGKTLEVIIDGEVINQNLELVVDAHTDAREEAPAVLHRSSSCRGRARRGRQDTARIPV